MDSTAGAPAGGTPTRSQVWTVERIRALGAVTDVATVGEIFGMSRSSAYELARTNRLPVPVLRVGSRYRVSVAAVLAALGVPTDYPPPPAT
ncbi:helix-turn-helix domain-containing protein [Solwaraspora sp. WMMD1047]|uniref:helix-turn-helix domain-containing protein n=1 Tax=Solwaraspora sp. WMMD1047 TaxID=3016102 RepID=UPI002416570C|nr:helix-turn-helix domain-containing protein [Solwaraspora sp. WMMD1047]MDG4834119.1 helix-turn-helix domain-containing protein [Solwaraspora sp. WMMD1047]